MSHLLIVELPGGNDVDIVQAALDRGDAFTFLSSELDHYRRQPAVWAVLARARELIEVPGFDDDVVEQRVLQLNEVCPVDAVLCLLDTRVPHAARLAARLGLRHLNPASAAMMRDKFKVRCRLAERGVTQPAFALATSNDELKAAVQRIGLPVLIKPVDGYGSQNIVVLRYPEDLDPLLTPLDDMLPCRADYGLGVRSNDRLLVEQFMSGTIIGVDTMTAAGCHVMLGVHQKKYFEPPSFAIFGSSFIPNGPQYAELQKYVFALLDAVDFDWGATHIELMMTSEGPRLIEINPRLVGAKIARVVACSLGRSLHEALIALHLGEGLPEISCDAALVAVPRWFTADQVGWLDKVVLPEWQDGRVKCVEILKQHGDAVRPAMDNADRIGYVIACASSRSEAESLAERYVADASVLIDARPGA